METKRERSSTESGRQVRSRAGGSTDMVMKIEGLPMSRIEGPKLDVHGQPKSAGGNLEKLDQMREDLY